MFRKAILFHMIEASLNQGSVSFIAEIEFSHKCVEYTNELRPDTLYDERV